MKISGDIVCPCLVPLLVWNPFPISLSPLMATFEFSFISFSHAIRLLSSPYDSSTAQCHTLINALECFLKVYIPVIDLLILLSCLLCGESVAQYFYGAEPRMGSGAVRIGPTPFPDQRS